jgi:CheY-like chemotaxis protein
MILVVDDDADARDALSELFKQHGYIVASAENGRAAIDRIHDWDVRPTCRARRFTAHESCPLSEATPPHPVVVAHKLAYA